MPAEIEVPSVTGYMSWLLRPFFWSWWAVLSGVTSILGFVLTPDSGITITRPVMLIGALLLSVFGFLGLSSAIQGWGLYFRKHRPIRVLSVQRVLSEQKVTQPHADLLFVIDGFLKGGGGTLLDLRIALEDAETPFCIVKVTASNRKQRQASFNDLKDGYEYRSRIAHGDYVFDDAREYQTAQRLKRARAKMGNPGNDVNQVLRLKNVLACYYKAILEKMIRMKELKIDWQSRGL